jgi:MYXO-CTERM domain-containing protein
MARPLDMATNRPPIGGDMAIPLGGHDLGGGNGAHSGCDAAVGGGTAASGFIVSLVLFLGAASTFRRRRA